MTGGQIDLTPLDSVVKAIGFLYWLLAAGALWFALRSPKGRRNKLLAVLFVTVLFGYVPASVGWREYQARGRLNASMKLFAERCKTAGEKITQTIENVDGVVWMKWREKYGNEDDADQWKLDDPYGRDCGLEGCIRQLLRVSGGREVSPMLAKQHSLGYRFVETVDPRDSSSYRYSAVAKPIKGNRQEYELSVKATGFGGVDDSFIALERASIPAVRTRYGIKWDDISTPEDREHWIAGGSLKVIDLQTNEVIGQRVGYIIDPGQGSTAGSRSPWGWAKAHAPSCPAVHATTLEFAVRVIKPTEGE
jgi:hypothetical protein